MEDIAADIMHRFAMADMDRLARSLSIDTQLYDQMQNSALESLGPIIAKQIQMQESLKPFLETRISALESLGPIIAKQIQMQESIKPFLEMRISALESLGPIIAKQIQMQESIKPFLEMRISALESLGPIIAKQIQMQESIKPFLEISIRPFLGLQYEAKKSLNVSSINQLELFAHERSSSILWTRCEPEISRSQKLCKHDSESETRDETDIAHSIQRLLITCNRAKKINGKDAIFKYTDRFVEAIVTLSRLNSGDEHSLGNLVDALYFLVYEGAGKDKLRFLSDFGGPLKSQDCEFVWYLKHLRNKWLRHDIEHGSEKSIKRSWKELKEALDFFGLDEIPRETDEFKYLHLNILCNAEIFLASLHDAVIENHAS